MDKLKRVFESENIRVGFDESVDPRGRILIASKDRGFTKYDRWVINHLSIDDACELRDRLDELLEETRRMYMGALGDVIGYIATPCPNCGRVRVKVWRCGKHICEKCHWCIEDEDYILDDEGDLENE